MRLNLFNLQIKIFNNFINMQSKFLFFYFYVNLTKILNLPD